jgi:hypothetical protein
VGIVVAGTFVALAPNLTRTAARQRQEDAALRAGVGPGTDEAAREASREAGAPAGVGHA